MKVLVSTDDGSVKEIVFNKGTDTSVLESLKPFNNQTLLRKDTSKKITKIYILPSSEETEEKSTDVQNKLVFFQNDGSIELRSFINMTKEPETKEDDESSEKKKKKSKDSDKFVQPTPKAFDIMQFDEAKPLDEITGMFDSSRLENIQSKSKKRSVIHDEFVSLQVLKNKTPTLCIGTKSGLIHLIQIVDDKLKFIITHEVKAPMDFLQYNDVNAETDGSHIFAYGGEENLIKLIKISSDFQTMTQVWEAKNLKNDKLDLKVPIWPMNVFFKQITQSDNLDTEKLNYEFLEVTKTGFIRHYKTQHGKKPMDNIDIIHDRPFQRQQWPSIIGTQFFNSSTTLNGNCTTDIEDSTSIVMADSRKNLLKIDAAKGLLKGKFGTGDIYGITTSIRNIGNKHLVCGGIDGYVRIYDIESRQRIAKIYCNFKVLECILLDESEVDTVQSVRKARNLCKKRKLTEDEQDKENDKLWDDLENQTTTKKAKV